VLETFSSDQPPTFQNQPAYVDILDKVLILFLWHQNTCIFLSLSLSRVASSIYNFSYNPELAFYSDRTLTDVSPTPTLISTHDEKAIMQMIDEQEQAEKTYGEIVSFLFSSSS